MHLAPSSVRQSLQGVGVVGAGVVGTVVGAAVVGTVVGAGIVVGAGVVADVELVADSESHFIPKEISSYRYSISRFYTHS